MVVRRGARRTDRILEETVGGGSVTDGIAEGPASWKRPELSWGQPEFQPRRHRQRSNQTIEPKRRNDVVHDVARGFSDADLPVHGTNRYCAGHGHRRPESTFDRGINRVFR